MASGLFAEYDLAVELLDAPGGGGAANTLRVADGGVDFCLTGVTYYLFARREAGSGLAARFVAVVHQRSPLAAIVAAESDIVEPDDLAGRRLARSEATGWLPDELVAVLAERRIAPPEIVPVTYGGPPSALASGTVDIMATFLDTTSQQQPTSGIATRAIHLGREIYASGLVAADRVPDDVVDRMVRAVRAAFQLQQREPEVGVEQFCRRFPNTARERVLETWNLLSPFVFAGPPVGSMDEHRWSETIRWLAGVHSLQVPPGAVHRASPSRVRSAM
jgi:ABC-type nitrate/sulfonate/bicarbonate transport system substrate-binding protein